MKGQKAYALARAIHGKMYADSISQNQEGQRVLYDQYFTLIKKAAYKGHVEGLFEMGQQFEDIGYLGIPNPMCNAKRCVYWYTEACQRGHPEACNSLSNFYALGDGCKQDFNMALKLLERSSELGSTLGKKNYKLKLSDLAKTGRYLR